MAKIERLTKRVREMEKWIDENEGGPTLNNMNYLLDMLRNASQQVMQLEQNFNTQRQLLGEYLGDRDLMQDWDDWLKEKDAIQKQQTEEVSVQEEAEGSEETIEAQEEEKE
jgi:hypothetical protein